MEDACSSSGSCPPEAADLSWFFQQWLHRGGVPRVRGSWHYDAASRKVNVSLGELQTQGFYRIPVELAITLPSTSATKPAEPSPDTASVKRVNVVLDGPLTTASFAVDAPPLDVQLDPDTWVPLMQATFGK
jgi:aminopeptidase N